MPTNEFISTLEDKEKVIQLFPELFGPDCEVLEGVSLEDLEESFLKYRDIIYNNSNWYTYDEIDKTRILYSYHYMRKLIVTRKEKLPFKNQYVRFLLSSYEGLIQSIANYKFQVKREGTYGFFQTNANHHILLELSTFKPMLMMLLENIDACLSERKDFINKMDFYDELEMTLYSLAEWLKETNNNLKDAQMEYFQTWQDCNRNSRKFVPKSELGYVHQDWRKQKNNACSTILSFYEEMHDMSLLLESEDENSIYTFSEIEEQYQIGRSYTTRGPNYYCYLNDEEKAQEIEKNNQKKKERKESKNPEQKN